MLHFRGQHGDEVRFSVTLTSGDVVVEGRAIEGRPIGRLAGLAFHAHDFAVARGERTRKVTYASNGTRHVFTLAGRRDAARLAYASCNGGESEEAARGVPQGRNAMWNDLLAAHARDPFHLLVMGGDQIYADAVWDEPAFKAWRAMGRGRWDAPFTDAMREAAEGFFLRRYGEVWGEPEIAQAFASMPCLMMWDDHDISDGWGSYPDHERLAPVAQGLFAVARRAFALFQLGTDPDAPGWRDGSGGFADRAGRHFGWSGRLGPASIVAPDLRSERTLTRVMDVGHEAFAGGVAEPASRTLVVSSVPLVNVDLSTVERWMRATPYKKYVDDLRDQWMSYAHEAEWVRVMDALFAAPVPVTVLSGEIHLAAHGTATRDGRTIDQLTASGIAHPPPPRLFGSLLDRFVRRPWRRGETELAMHPLGETGRRYLAVRNWLEVEVASDGSLAATVHAEGMGPVRLVPAGASATRPRHREMVDS